MTAADFSAFYSAVHCYPPFPWQQRLLDTVVNKGWPSTISLPTSSGKTSVIDIAVFHLALEASRPALERAASLRIFFVIDRRVVVDEAAEHATKLAKALLTSNDPAVVPVAEALRSFGAEYPLDVAVLRGGMYRDNTWVDEPNQPLVCVSTVDQVGSRLLFRGYQVSDEAKPVHAGLVGNDALIIVDEAHLSVPFLDTLAAAGRMGGGLQKIGRGIELVKMSATIPASDEPFDLDGKDYEATELSERLTASKPTQLRIPAKGFEDELVRSAKELAGLPSVSVIGVVVNTVAVARAVFEQLRQAKDSTAILLTGRNRPYQSSKLWAKFKDRIAAKKDRVSEGRLYVVATQTVEVGANLDFDALVTESAPLDSLRQRFGRLNRLGKSADAQAVIVRRPKQDPVYGEPTARTWELLVSMGKVDFGVMAMKAALDAREFKDCNAESDCGPLVLAKYLELWAQTNPAPYPDPDVAPFLHGRKALDDADIQVVWRADLGNGDWQSKVEAAPPVSSESLPLPLGGLRRWLRGESRMDVADIEGVQFEPEVFKESKSETRAFLIWRGDNKSTRSDDARDIRPGDVVVVPTSYGGCDEFGWHPASTTPVQDIGDLANNEMAMLGLRKPRIRLRLFAEENYQKGSEEQKQFLSCLEAVEDESYEGIAEREDAIKDALKDKLEPAIPGEPQIDFGAGVAVWPRKKKQSGILPAKPEDQDDDSAGQDKPISLRVHTQGVVDHARKYATKCGLNDRLLEDLVLAAELHDLGKWDFRFQAWLCGGSPVKAAKLDEPLAKGVALTIAERKKHRALAKYPQRARHEAASVLVASASGALEKAHDKDLVMHLIGTHHGHGRPLLPVWEEEDDAETVSVELDGKRVEVGTGWSLGMVDSGWLDRFVRLNERYGYWGLAYLETILRRADCMQSREEQES